MHIIYVPLCHCRPVVRCDARHQSSPTALSGQRQNIGQCPNHEQGERELGDFIHTCTHTCAQVEYDLAHSSEDDLQLLSVDRIEQSAVPTALSWYPPLSKESFLLLANDQVGPQGPGGLGYFTVTPLPAPV